VPKGGAVSAIEQRGGYWTERHYQRLVKRGEKQLWTNEDVARLKARVDRIAKQREKA
jgi:hypothetical protein